MQVIKNDFKIFNFVNCQRQREETLEDVQFLSGEKKDKFLVGHFVFEVPQMSNWPWGICF